VYSQFLENLDEEKKQIIMTTWPVTHQVLGVPPKNDDPAYACWAATMHKIIVAFEDYLFAKKMLRFRRASAVQNWMYHSPRVLGVPPKNDDPAYACWAATMHKIIVKFPDHFPPEEGAIMDGAGLHSMENWHQSFTAIKLYWTHRNDKEPEKRFQDRAACVPEMRRQGGLNLVPPENERDEQIGLSLHILATELDSVQAKRDQEVE
jgi:hypothetical protein